MHDPLLSDIAIAILGAAVLGFPAMILRIPLLLAYLAAGVILGPHLGLGLVKSAESIATLSEIGLVLLMFILGLEIDLRKLMQAGKAVLVNGVTQFIACFALGLLFFNGFGFRGGAGPFELTYLAMAASLSSTLIVVKILSDRMEIDSLTSRITLGVLVIQDLWAIGFLAVQPDLANISAMSLAVSLGKALLLVSTTWIFARKLLPQVFSRVGMQPELMLIVAMAWCFGACGLASYLHLSLEMGALVAGISIAALPYHADVAAKISSLRDFFITLFFVSLGLQIPAPTASVLTLASSVVTFVLFSRLLTVYPVLHIMKYGNRASLLPALNLSQLSEFALVLSTLGVGYGHVSRDLVSAFTIALVASALISSFVVPAGHRIYKLFNPWLERIGFRDHVGAEETVERKSVDVVFLGFYREASSLLNEMRLRYSRTAIDKILIVDFNPEAHRKLEDLELHCKYGDVSNLDTLRGLELHTAKLIVSTIPDYRLRGTNNLTLLKTVKKLAPQSRIIVTAETIASAREMYKEGADYVMISRLISAHYLADVIEKIQTDPGPTIRNGAIVHLEKWDEVLP